MKNLIIFLFFIGLSLASFAQNDTTRYTMVNGYGFTYNRLKAKAALVMPTDTVQNKLPGSIVILNDTMYVRTNVRWQAVTAGAGLPAGGTTGQILAKNSATNYDVAWIDNYTTDVREYVKASVAINKGQAVYVSGADGTNVLVSKASNTTEATSSKTLGLMFQNLAQNGQGYVIIQGKLSGLNTLGTNVGDPVWLGTNGNLLYGIANKPVAPANLVYMGVVTRVNANNGEIFVHVQNGFELEELHDVSVVNKQNGQGIVYDSATGLWKNRWVLTDTTTLSNRINTKVNISDTSAMLTPYLRKADTATLSNRINLKVNISDTASMLSPYYRTATANAALATKVNISDTSTMLTPYVRAAGYGLTKSGQTLTVDTLNIATRAWRQKGLDSLAALEVSGSGTTNYVSKFTASGTIGNSQIFDNGTRVGIGTAAPAARLDIRGSGLQDLYFISTTGSNQENSIQSYFNNGGGWSDLSTKSQNLLFYTGPSGGPTTERLRITSGGDIGMSQPSLLWSATNRRLLELNGTSQSLIGLNVNSLKAGYIWQNGNDMTIAVENAGYLQFGTNGSSDRMRIFSTGRVGINTITDAGYQLDVNGTFRSVNGTNLATGSGSVGIGNTSPTGKLDIYETATVNQQLVLRNAGTYHTGFIGTSTANPLSDAFAWGMFGGPNNYLTGINNSVAITLGASVPSFQITKNNNLNSVPNSTYFYLNNTNGQVGIGTTSPSELLDVNGRIRARTIDSTASAMNVLYADATGVIKKASATAFPGGSGSTNILTKWTGANMVGNSSVFDNGTILSTTTSVVLNPSTAGNSFLQFKYNLTDVGLLGSNSSIDGSTAGDLGLYVYGSNNLDLWSNNTRRMRIFGNGRIGVNTTTDAGFQFDVNGTARINSDLRVNSTTGFNTLFTQPIGGGGLAMVSTSDPTAAGQRLYSLGFGSVNYPAQARIEAMSTEVWSSTNRGSALRFNTTPNGTAGSQIRMYIENDGFVGINTSTPLARLHVAGNMRSDNDAYFATASGNVGIGTTSPVSKLQIQGAQQDAAQTITRFAANNASGQVKAIDLQINAGSNLAVFNTAYAGSAMGIDFADAGTSRIRIDASGNVGIGTQGPAYRLDVLAPTGVARALRFSGNAANDNTSLIISGKQTGAELWAFGNEVATGSTGRNFDIYDLVANSNRLRITSGGNFLINTLTDAGYRMDINGNTRVTGTMSVTANTSFAHNVQRNSNQEIASQIFNSGGWIISGAEGVNGGAIFTGSTPYAAVVGSGYNRPLQIATNNTVRMEIDSVGLVGINTVTPTERLDVNGRVRIRTVDSTATATNMLYVDNNGVVKKTAVPGSNVSYVTSTNTAASGWTFAKDSARNLNHNFVNVVLNNTSNEGTVTLQMAFYRATSSFTTGQWVNVGSLSSAYTPKTTIIFELPGYVSGTTYYTSGNVQFSGASEYTGTKVVRIDPSGNVDVRIGTVSASATASGTNYVLIPIVVTYALYNVPL